MSLVDSILNFFIAPADAASSLGAQPQAGGGFPLILMLVVFVLFMYFGVWRPQSRRAKEQRDLINSLQKGDEVMTAGGMLGRIVKVSENYVVLAITDNTEIIMQKGSIVGALPKGTIKSVN